MGSNKLHLFSNKSILAKITKGLTLEHSKSFHNSRADTSQCIPKQYRSAVCAVSYPVHILFERGMQNLQICISCYCLVFNTICRGQCSWFTRMGFVKDDKLFHRYDKKSANGLCHKRMNLIRFAGQLDSLLHNELNEVLHDISD